jgi:diguanylate cyclase (GGDEF)-like protein
VNSHRHDTTRTLQRRTSRPQPDEAPYLIGVAGEHAGRLFCLAERQELVIGRTEDCEVRISLDEMVSRRHARLELIGENWQVRDLDSLNGTRVNGRDATMRMPLRRGDWVELGEYTSFKFDYLSEQERVQRESGLVDGLTEIWNRKAFEARLPELFRQAEERKTPLSLLMVDVDHFKEVNDTFGHQAGDHALQAVAGALRNWLDERDSDAVVCRYGGEEFAVLLPGCSTEACAETAENLRTEVATLPLQLAGARHRITASLGGATLTPGSHPDPAALIKAADDNLYLAKRAGRNRCVLD